ncbi:hypothetical protein [Terriglobus roseus]|uniref:HNH endonuclease n=1 Tax=Terriglobus roseus TaxID=392734 RepID=A0A1H4JDG7_9BACT|nr:hypothetical protein [Terriglobus roseus]SEB44323.1 hypothetical protein SAMN05443244_0545 [Terriglobus roseus]
MKKINPHNRCVYTSPAGLCSGSSRLHPKEHYLPAGFGNFNNDLRLKDYICNECQRRFSKPEEVFLRNSTEAFFRSILDFKGRRSHEGKNIFVEPTLGLPPLTVKGLHPALQHELLWQPTSSDEAFLLHQLVFRKPDGTLQHMAIRPGLIAQDLARWAGEWKGWQLVVCIAGDAEEPELQSILGSALETMGDAPMDVMPGQELEARMDAPISLPYLQAMAKIAFHFVLARFHFSGFETEFDEVKRFIYQGTGKPPVKTVDDVIMPELVPEEARLRQWNHILTAEFNRDGFFARMQFFAGSRLKPITWRVYLGQNPSRILEEQGVGFRYPYYDQPDRSGYVGEVIEMQQGPRVLAKL